MPPDTPEDLIGDLAAKLDAVLARVAALEPPLETPKTDARDTSLAKGAAFFKTYLDKVLPTEKLDTLTFDELVLAAELKSQIQPSHLNPAPPLTPKPDATSDPRPDYLRPTVA